MSRTFHHGKRRNYRPLRVRDVRKDPPDARRVARALIALVQAQSETDARSAPTKRPKPTSAPHQRPRPKDRPNEPEVTP